MNYDKPELIRRLAAEYAIGTLRGPARRRFERLSRSQAEARDELAFWELRLSEFGQVLEPVTPPERTRRELLRRIDEPASHIVKETARKGGARTFGWAWPYAAGFASAAALALAFLLGQQHPASVPDSPLLSAAKQEIPIPIYAAQVGLPASEVQWLLSLSPDHRKLSVVAAKDFLQVGRRRVQLWALAAGQAAVPLGVLPVEGNASAVFDIPPTLRGHAEVSFVISLEPSQGSLSDQPSGLVLKQGRALGGI